MTECPSCHATAGRPHTEYCKPPVPYFCPTSGETEINPGGGFDVCCDAPEKHRPLTEEDPT